MNAHDARDRQEPISSSSLASAPLRAIRRVLYRSGIAAPPEGGSVMEEIGAWFFGPKAENHEILERFVREAIGAVTRYRKGFHPEDPPAITEAIKHSPAYLASIDALARGTDVLLENLTRYATPLHSMRYQAHMLWDCTLPALVGYFAAMLHNSNNVAPEVSTLTTYLEHLVGEDLCRMLGYETGGAAGAWGHITADGTIANAEALWAARELKYLPLALREAVRQDAALSEVSRLEIGSAGGGLADLSTWELLNLDPREILELVPRAAKIANLEVGEVRRRVTARSLNAVGVAEMHTLAGDSVGAPVVLMPATGHYCWRKVTGLLGLGHRQLVPLPVDADARLRLDEMREALERCLAGRRPVLLAVVVPGSTEESAVDPIDGVLALRDEFRARGLSFAVHADAAWGGYFVTTLRAPFDESPDAGDPFIADTSRVPLGRHTIAQLKQLRRCDSITVDPHKCGYVPYPAGSLCYRDGRVRELVDFGAAYIGSDQPMLSMGQYGIEGSKPGASAASVYLSHCVIRPTIDGYGKLLGRAMINAKLLYLRLLGMARPGDPFFVVPLPRLPTEREQAGESAELAERTFIAERLMRRSAEQIESDPEALALFHELGPDQNVLCYAFNLRDAEGRPNGDLDLANALNRRIYDALHVRPGEDVRRCDIFVSHTVLASDDYGPTFMRSYLKRLGLTEPPQAHPYGIIVLRSVVMDPWMAETSVDGGDFFDIIVEQLRATALDAARAIEL